MSDPSFVLVQVEGARERMEAVVAQFVGTKHNSATRSAFVQAILSALGLDQPGVPARTMEALAGPGRLLDKFARSYWHDGLSDDAELCRGYAAELRAALAAAKEVGDG